MEEYFGCLGKGTKMGWFEDKKNSGNQPEFIHQSKNEQS